MKRCLLLIPFILVFLLIHDPAFSQEKLWGMTPKGGASGKGLIFNLNKDGSDLTTVYEFQSPTAGRAPYYTQLLEADNGKLYGLTYTGGSHDLGVLFEYVPSTGTYSVKANFTGENGSRPTGSLMQARDGKLYGMAGDGPLHAGVIFQYDIASEQFAVVYAFEYSTGNAGMGSLIEGTEGILYGLGRGGSHAEGTIFTFDINTKVYSKKHDFDFTTGAHPRGDLLLASNGKLYGLTADGGLGYGVIFEYDMQQDKVTTRKVFNATDDEGYILGKEPTGNLVELPNGKLYGMTSSGGGEGWGESIIFEYDPLTDLYAMKKELYVYTGVFAASEGSLAVGANGLLYGITSRIAFGTSAGFVFEYNPGTEMLSHFEAPHTMGTLMQASNGKFYGLADGCGIAGAGCLFEVDAAEKTTTWKVQLNYAPDGATPQGSLTRARNGKLYGVTETGGTIPQNYGVLFEVDPVTEQYRKVLDFESSAGRPYGSLVLHPNGNLFGMTTWGGVRDGGAIFEFDVDTGTLLRKIYLDPSDGSDPIEAHGYDPFGNLALAPNGKFYGLAKTGGGSLKGVLFEFDPAGDEVVKKIDFNGSNGAFPMGSLVVNNDGKLYGMTQEGGANGIGTIFRYDPQTNTLSKRYDFSGTMTVSVPYSSSALTVASNNLLYGTTWIGGNDDVGLLFSFNPVNDEFTPEYHFHRSEEGFRPCGYLIESGGKLYGMTNVGKSGAEGSVYEFDPVSKSVTFITSFNNANGAHPYSNSLTSIHETITAAEEPAEQSIVVYPNPATSHLHIESSRKPRQITLTDMMGKRVLTFSGLPAVTDIDISSLASGPYILMITGSGDQVRKFKLIKKK